MTSRGSRLVEEREGKSRGEGSSKIVFLSSVVVRNETEAFKKAIFVFLL